MTKYLVLNFENAGLIRNHKGTKDKNFDFLGASYDNIGRIQWKDRKKEDQFMEPITHHQISNVLHVLFSERPKPHNRTVIYNKIDWIDKKAEESYLRIDSYRDKEENFIKEKFQTNKAMFNSFSKSSYMNWNRVKKLLGDDLFEKFSQIIKNSLDLDPNNLDFDKSSKIIKSSKNKKLDEFFILLKKEKKNPLYDYIFLENEGSFNMNSKTLITVNRGIEEKIILRGSIVIPVDQNEIEILKKGKGVATILDGGLVYIKSLNRFFNPEGYTKVSEISKEKVKS